MNGNRGRSTLIAGSIAALVLVGLGFVAFKGQTLVGIGRSAYEAEIESAVGVNPFSSDVRVRGIRVGEVTEVDVSGDRAIVRFRVADDIDVRADAQAALRLKNILGEKYLELTPGDARESLAGPISLESTDTSTDLGAMIGAAGPTLSEYSPDDIAAAREYAQSLVDRHAPTAADMLADARDALHTLAEDPDAGLSVIDDIDVILSTVAANRETIAQASADVAAVLSDVEEFTESHGPLLVRLLVDTIALRSVIDARWADLALAGERIPAGLALARTLVAHLVDNLENGGHPLPIGVTNFGPALARDHGAPPEGGGS